MKRHSVALVMLICAVGLGGCAISGGADVDASAARSKAAPNAALPPLPPVDVASLPEPVLPDVQQVDKFSQSKDTALIAQSDQVSSVGAESNDINQQAYASAAFPKPVIRTANASLKPFVGRWVLKPSTTRDKVQKIGSYLGLSEGCEVVLEEATSSSGYKASGNSACPTSLFMLDSWAAFGNRLVLRDHMGDDIVKLTSRGTDTWIGVSKDGRTLVFNKS